jgi:hypothetical protein
MVQASKRAALTAMCRRYGPEASGDTIEDAVRWLEGALHRDTQTYQKDIAADLDRLEWALDGLASAVERLQPQTVALLYDASRARDRRIEELTAAESYPPRKPDMWPAPSWAVVPFDPVAAILSRFPALIGSVDRDGRRRPGVIDDARTRAAHLYAPGRSGRKSKDADERRRYLVFALGTAYAVLTGDAPGYSRHPESSGSVDGKFADFVTEALHTLELDYAVRTLTEDAYRAFRETRA